MLQKCSNWCGATLIAKLQILESHVKKHLKMRTPNGPKTYVRVIQRTDGHRQNSHSQCSKSDVHLTTVVFSLLHLEYQIYL